jgi:hypothetical protein
MNRCLNVRMKATLLAAMLGPLGVAQAALIDQGNTTLDTASGLTWLDLTESTFKAPSTVIANFGIGGLYAGYRYATEIELRSFFVNAGFGDSTSTNDLVKYNAAVKFQALVGITAAGGGSTLSNGYFGDADGIHFGYGALVTNPGLLGSYVTILPRNFVGDAPVEPTVGSWLVLSAVPEVTSLFMMVSGLGCVGLLLRSRRKSRQPGSDA